MRTEPTKRRLTGKQAIALLSDSEFPADVDATRLTVGWAAKKELVRMPYGPLNGEPGPGARQA